MNALSTKFAGANLPKAGDLAKALRQVDTGDDNGGMLMKMDKTGQWVYGASEKIVSPKSVWAVNPLSFTHGYIAWGGKEVLEEHMASITDPLPSVGPAPVFNDPDYKGWQVNLGVQFACIEGPDKGVQVTYQTTSVGGKKAIQSLCMAVAEQIDVDAQHPVPTITLASESYKHKRYGKIFAPIVTIDENGWMSMQGAAEATEDDGDYDDADLADEAVGDDAEPETVEAEVVEETPAEEVNNRRRRRPGR